MLAMLKNKKSSEEKHYLLIFTIILYLSLFFVPLVVVYIAQDSLYHSKTHWFFSTPTSAYLTFGGGLLWIAVVLTMFLFLRNTLKGKAFRIITILLVLLSLPTLVLAIQNYYYFDEEGLHYNKLMSVKQLDVGWSDIEKMTKVHQVQNGTLYLIEYEFALKSGETISVPNNDQITEWRKYITQNLEENNVPILTVEIESEE